MRTTLTTLSILCLALFAGAALAQGTPDGETPAQETVCDAYRNMNGPAFGLCNAWCEAMDCHCYNEGSTCVPRASQTACDRVADRFEAKTGDPLTVCEVAPPAVCPCTNLGDPWNNVPVNPTWADFATSMFKIITSCDDDGSMVTVSEDLGDGLVDTASVTISGEFSFCELFDDGIEEDVSDTTDFITQAEAEDCASILRAQAAESPAGVVCN